ncbi:MAG TPA: hypothetical protein VKB87_16065 [Myxococcaceae bacterium]|nr:hypothetical protein [Myxococcaceae bacterium]
MKNPIGNALLGAAVAGILAAVLPAQAQKIPAEKLKKMEVVPCYGVNSCKGAGQCSGVGHECAGENSCKGQGWLAIPKEACLAIEGGSLTPTKG